MRLFVAALTAVINYYLFIQVPDNAMIVGSNGKSERMYLALGKWEATGVPQ